MEKLYSVYHKLYKYSNDFPCELLVKWTKNKLNEKYCCVKNTALKWENLVHVLFRDHIWEITFIHALYSNEHPSFWSSSVASPICRRGKVKEISRFFPDFSWFFSDFWQLFRCQGWHSAPPCHPSGYSTVLKWNYQKGLCVIKWWTPTTGKVCINCM